RGARVPVADAAEHDAQTPLIGDDGLGRSQAEHRVVVTGVVDESAVVDRLVALAAEGVDQLPLEVEARVVGAEVDAHADSVPVRWPNSLDSPRSPWVSLRHDPGQ